MAADWCIANGWPDFAAAWRDTVDLAECQRVAATGLLDLWDRGIGAALPIVSAPYVAGDIAVVRHLGLEGGSIFTGERWAMELERGVAFIPLPQTAILKAWRP